jgi:hypothetical protein
LLFAYLTSAFLSNFKTIANRLLFFRGSLSSSSFSGIVASSTKLKPILTFLILGKVHVFKKFGHPAMDGHSDRLQVKNEVRLVAVLTFCFSLFLEIGNLLSQD